MGLPRKGSRAITVDGYGYRWVAVYARLPNHSACCPVRLVVQRQGGHGRLLLARFQGIERDDTGQDWVRLRYGAELTPAKVTDIIRAGRAAGWDPDAVGQPPLELDGEPFLRLSPDPNAPPPGSEDELRQKILASFLEHLLNDRTGPDRDNSTPSKPGASPNRSNTTGFPVE